MKFARSLFAVVIGIGTAALAAGCGSGGSQPRIDGADTDLTSLSNSIITSVPGPLNGSEQPLDPSLYTSRDVFGTSTGDLNVLSAMARNNLLSGPDQAKIEHGLHMFITDFTPEQGLGPYFNGRTCMDCHQGYNTAVVRTPGQPVNSPPIVQSIVSRGQSGSGFTLFGDYSPATGQFNPLTEFGGPFLHERTCNGAPPQVIPPESIDPNLRNAGMVRAVGIRAAPPYIARGFFEAIPDGEIARFDDPFDSNGDGISGRHNENHENIAFVGGSPVVRLARFGVRAGGTTLLMFMLGGTCQQIGLTTPFCPRENNGQTTPGAYDPVPDPELSEQDVFDFRSFVRSITPPAMAPLSHQSFTVSIQGADPTRAADSINGAHLFGVQLDANNQPTWLDSTGNFNFGLSADANVAPNLNCATCHIPFQHNGGSPAELQSEQTVLSHKIFPIFSDMLLHDMGANDADAALPAGTSGLATPREFRTPPLLGLNFAGPPFFHDARVTVGNLDQAILTAIQIHDNYGQDTDSEANNSLQRFRRLTPAQQQDVIAFLKSL